MSSPTAVTSRTRPPAVTIRPPSRAVPAWKTTTPSRGRHDRHAGAGSPGGLQVLEPPPRLGRHEELEKIALQEREDRLGFGVAEAGVPFEHLGAVRGQHEAGVEAPRVDDFPFDEPLQ